MDRFIDLGKYIEIGINALEETFTSVWSAMDDGISWLVNSMNNVLLAVPFVVFLLFVTLLSYYAKTGRKAFTKEGFKKGWGLAIFIIIGFFFIYGMCY